MFYLILDIYIKFRVLYYTKSFKVSQSSTSSIYSKHWVDIINITGKSGVAGVEGEGVQRHRGSAALILQPSAGQSRNVRSAASQKKQAVEQGEGMKFIC